MLVYRRSEDRVEHARVRDIGDYLDPAAKIVLNETRVAPMRFVATRGDRRTEGLFVSSCSANRWLVMLKGAKQFKAGDKLELEPPDGASGGDSIVLAARNGIHWEVEFPFGVQPMEVIERSGRTPLPPYILHSRKVRGMESIADSSDRVSYQTTFAQQYSNANDRPSCAAPTAGLHFTPELLSRLGSKGITTVRIELQVGTGTFRPLESERLSGHEMHSERCVIRREELLKLENWNKDLNLVVGTTCARLLESIPVPFDPDMPLGQGGPTASAPSDIALDFATDILIGPGYEFNWTGQMLTNFHLPRSTLLALVGAMVGIDRLKSLYSLAQKERYRFYSLGDSMLILT